MARKEVDNEGEEPNEKKIAHPLTDLHIRFAVLESEAAVLLKNHEYETAATIFTEALFLKPNSLSTLWGRSVCYLNDGKIKESEKDADSILAINPNSRKGHLCKAEALFAAGDFELSMVWFTRGTRFKMEQDKMIKFQLGIERCKDVIEIAIQSFDPDKVRKLIVKTRDSQKFTSSLASSKKPVKKVRHEMTSSRAELDQHLLGELFEDYLLLRELELDFGNSDDIVLVKHISKGLDYLDSRIEFWRARNPKGLPDRIDLYQPKVAVDGSWLERRNTMMVPNYKATVFPTI